MADRPALPYWPRHLSRELAAAYVGVSIGVFDDEVAAGLWPPARRRGAKGGRLTWDRALLDQVSDRDAGLTAPGQADNAPAPDLGPMPALGSKSNGTTARRRDQNLPQKAA